MKLKTWRDIINQYEGSKAAAYIVEQFDAMNKANDYALSYDDPIPFYVVLDAEEKK